MQSSRNFRGLATGIGIVAAGFLSTAATAYADPALSPHAVETNIHGIYAITEPPAGFDPRLASDAELRMWGLPPRPGATEGPEALANWTRLVTAHVTRVVPQLKSRPDIHHRPVENLKILSPATTAKAATATSSNWSGVVLMPGTGAQKFFKILAEFSIPTVQQPPGTCSSGWDYAAEWVGIGGYSDAYLFQSGVSTDAYCDIPGSTVTEYSPWVEWLPAAELVIYENEKTNTLYPMQPGDFVIVEVWATAFNASGVSTTGNLLYENLTQGWSVSLTGDAASFGGSEVTGNSAEWIVERPMIGKNLATLPDYTANPWIYTVAYDRSNVGHFTGAPGTSSVYNLTMLDNSNKPESFVNLFGTETLWFFPEGSAK